MTIQTSLEFGKKLRDAGIEQSVRHANDVTPRWSEQAFELFRVFVKLSPAPFMTEDFREYTEGKLTAPPSARAFGGIVRRAAHMGLIRKIGTDQVKNATAHCANANVWQRI